MRILDRVMQKIAPFAEDTPAHRADISAELETVMREMTADLNLRLFDNTLRDIAVTRAAGRFLRKHAEALPAEPNRITMGDTTVAYDAAERTTLFDEWANTGTNTLNAYRRLKW